MRQYFASAGLIDVDSHYHSQIGQVSTQVQKMMKYSQSTEKKRGRAVDGARALTDSVLMAFLNKVLLKLKNQVN